MLSVSIMLYAAGRLRLSVMLERSRPRWRGGTVVIWWAESVPARHLRHHSWYCCSHWWCSLLTVNGESKVKHPWSIAARHHGMQLTCHNGSHMLTVTRQTWHSRFYPSKLRLVLNLTTLEGCKAELTRTLPAVVPAFYDIIRLHCMSC